MNLLLDAIDDQSQKENNMIITQQAFQHLLDKIDGIETKTVHMRKTMDDYMRTTTRIHDQIFKLLDVYDQKHQEMHKIHTLKHNEYAQNQEEVVKFLNRYEQNNTKIIKEITKLKKIIKEYLFQQQPDIANDHTPLEKITPDFRSFLEEIGVKRRKKS